jgi:hypothetical protein
MRAFGHVQNCLEEPAPIWIEQFFMYDEVVQLA